MGMTFSMSISIQFVENNLSISSLAAKYNHQLGGLKSLWEQVILSLTDTARVIRPRELSSMGLCLNTITSLKQSRYILQP
jgi:hypothetical protein